MAFDVTSQNYLSIAFVLIVVLSLALAIFKMYLLRKMHAAKAHHLSGEARHTHAQEQYISRLDKENHRLQNISTIMLFIVSVPAMMFTFIMTITITGSVVLGIILSLAVYAATMYTLRTRVLTNQ